MKPATHYRDLLARETAHLPPAEQALRDQCLALACDYANIPGVIAEAITIKLLTLVDGAPYWLRLLVSKAALEAVAAPVSAAA